MAVKRPGTSTRPGASAHHGRPLPSVSRTAIRPCTVSSSVYGQLAFPPFNVIRSARTSRFAIGSSGSSLRKRYPLPTSDHPPLGSATVAASPEPALS